MKYKNAASACVSWYVDWSPWIAGVLALFFLGLFGGIMSIDASKFLSDSVTTQWVAAIATFAAALVALGIALRQELIQRRRDNEVGELAAAQYRNYVGAIRVRSFEFRGELPGATITLPESGISELLTPPVPGGGENARYLIDALKEIPLATIRPYSPKIAALIAHMIDQLKVAEIGAPFPGGSYVQNQVLSEFERLCLQVEALMGDAHTHAIAPYLTARDTKRSRT